MTYGHRHLTAAAIVLPLAVGAIAAHAADIVETAADAAQSLARK